MAYTKGNTPHNKKAEPSREKMRRLRASIELPSMLWCADFWLKTAVRLTTATYNRRKHNLTLICGLQLSGISEETTRQVIDNSLEQELIERIPTYGDGNIQYDITLSGIRFAKAITCTSELMSRATFDDTFPFASNLHINRGHRFKGKF